ncbi:tripartite motif-containing protein 16-like, partial [Clarias magur]
VCINDCWDQEDLKGVYSCPQCRDTFTPRPVLRRNNMDEVVEKLKKNPETSDASPAHCDPGPGDVECDPCTGRTRQDGKCCTTCLSCFCLKRNQTKYTSFEAERICSEHNKLIEIDCCTDQSYICSLCMLNKRQGRDAESTEAERAEKQSELDVQELKQAVNTIKVNAQKAVEQIKAWEETELSRPQRESPTCERHRLFDGVRNSLSDLKKTLEEFCEEEFNKIPPHVEDAQSSLSEPQSRDEFLK